MTWTARDRQVRAALEAEWLGWCSGDEAREARDLLHRCRQHDDDAWADVLTAAQSGQVAAARVALQALLPALVRLAARDRSRSLSEYVSAGWLRIYDHPIKRRRHRVLTNVALDTLKTLSRERDRRAHPTLTEWFDQPMAETLPREGERADAVITAATRLGVISASAAPVLRSVYADGLSGRQAAARHRESYEMVRYRCSRAVRQMRVAREVLLAAA